MEKHEGKRIWKRKTTLLLMLFAAFALAVSAVLGIAASYGAFAAGSSSFNPAGKQKEFETGGAPAYDSVRPVTVTPGQDAVIDGLYLFNPDGSIMPAYNNHLHIQVNFTYTPGTVVEHVENGVSDPENKEFQAGSASYTYKYSADLAMQSLGNNGTGLSTETYYPRGLTPAQKDNNEYLFKIVYTPSTTDPSFKLTVRFNSMTPTGEGTFDIRYFGHPSSSTDCDYTAASGMTGDHDYYYFDYCYLKDITCKQAIKVKVEMPYNSDPSATSNGSPVPTHPGEYMDLTAQKPFVVDATGTMTKKETVFNPSSFVDVTYAGGNDFNGTYSFVDGSFEILRNDAKNQGQKERFNVSDYFVVDYQPYVTDLVKDRSHGSADGRYEPVPTSVSNYGTNASSKYFSGANAIRLKVKDGATVEDLYGYTFYCKAMVKRYGHTMAMQSQVMFSFRIDDPLLQVENSRDDGQDVPPAEFTLKSAKAGGTPTVLTIDQIVSFADTTRYSFAEFGADVNGGVFKYCDNDTASMGSVAKYALPHPEGRVRHANNSSDYYDATGQILVTASAVAGDPITSIDNTKAKSQIQFVRDGDHMYSKDALYVLVRVKDNRYVGTGDGTTLLCVRLGTPSEGMTESANLVQNVEKAVVSAFPYDAANGTEWATPLDGAGGDVRRAVSYVTYDVNKKGEIRIMLHNYLKFKEFDFSNVSTYADAAKRDYGVKFTADMFYDAITTNANIVPKFIPKGSTLVNVPYKYQDSNTGTYYSWMLTEDGELFVYPYRSTQERSETFLSLDNAIDVVLHDNTGAVVDSEVFKTMSFYFGVENSAPEKDALTDIGTLSKNYVYNNGSGDTSEANVARLLANTNKGYNAYKNGIANANAHDLKNVFELDVYDVWKDVDVFRYQNRPQSGFDALSFIVSTNAAIVGSMKAPDRNYIQVYVLKEGLDAAVDDNWVKLEEYSGADGDRVRKLRFVALSSTASASSGETETTISIADNRGKRVSLTFRLIVEDSRPYYRAEDENPAGEAPATKASESVAVDALYRSAVMAYHPMLLRATPIADASTLANYRFLKAFNNNAKGIDFYDGFQDVPTSATYNINDMLVDPDSPNAKTLGFAPNADGDTLSFHLSDPNGFFDGDYTATVSGNWFVCTVSKAATAGGDAKDYFKIEFSAMQMGVVRVTALNAYSGGNIKLTFSVTANGAPLPDDADKNTYEYGFAIGLLDTLPKALKSSDTLNLTTTDSLTFDPSSLKTDGYLAEDGSQFYLVPEFIDTTDTVKMSDYLQFWDYNSNAAGDKWTKVTPQTDTEGNLVYTVPGDTQTEDGQPIPNYKLIVTRAKSGSAGSIQISKKDCSPRNDAGKPRIRFYVTKFNYADANLNRANLSGNIADFAVPIEFTFNFETPSFGIDSTAAAPIVTMDTTNNDKWSGAYYKIGFSDLKLKEIAADGSASGADVSLSNVTFAQAFDVSDTENKYRRNISISFADAAKPNLYFGGEDYATRIGVKTADVDQTTDPNYDIILDYVDKAIWVKPQSRTVGALYSEITVNLSRPDGGKNKTTPITFTFAVPNSTFILMQDENAPLASFNGLESALAAEHKGFFVGGEPVYLRVKRAETQAQVAAKTAVEYDSVTGRRYLTVYADSAQSGLFRDLYDNYYFKAGFTAGTNLTVTKAEGAKELTVGSDTYYSELKVLPNAYATPSEKDKLKLSLNVADLISVGMTTERGTDVAMAIQFEAQYAGITVGDAGQLDLSGKTPFYAHTEEATWIKTGAGASGFECPDKALGGCDGNKLNVKDSAEKRTAVFCDGVRHYAAVNYTHTFGKLSRLLTSGDYNVDAQGKMTNATLIGKTTLQLKLTNKATGAVLKETTATLTDLFNEGVLDGEYFTISSNTDQNVLLTLKKYYAGAISATLTLTNTSNTNMDTKSASYAFEVSMQANETIVRQNADSSKQNYIDVQLSSGANGYTAMVNLADYAYNFCGADSGALTFGDFVFPDRDSVFARFYQDYVTGAANDDHTQFTLTLKKLHSKELHAQEYQVQLPILRDNAAEAGKEARVRFFFKNDSADTKVNKDAGALSSGKYLSIKDGFENLYEIPSGSAMAVYASKEYYMTDPYGDNIYFDQFFNTVGVDTGFILGADGEIGSSVHGALTFDTTDRNNGKAMVMKIDGGDVSQVTGISGDRFATLSINKNAAGAALTSSNTSYSGKGFDPKQAYSYMVQAAQRLTDENQFIRVTFVLRDTAGNRVTWPSLADNGTEGLVTIDFRTVNSEMKQNVTVNESDFSYQEGTYYDVNVWSAGEAFRAKYNNEDREPGADELPSYYGSGFPLSYLITDGDYANEDFEVYMNVNGDGTTMEKLSAIPSEIYDGSGNVVAKVAYENKRLYFYALSKCTQLYLPEIEVRSAEMPTDTVTFNRGDVRLTIPNSDPILRANAKTTFDVSYSRPTYVTLASYMYDYDKDDSIQLANRDPEYKFVEKTAEGDKVTSDEVLNAYVGRVKDTYGVTITCKNLWVTVGEEAHEYQFSMKLYYTADLYIELRANYNNPAPEFLERFEEGFDIPYYSGEELKIVYTGTEERPAKVGTTHNFDLNQFMNLSSYLKNNQYLTLTLNNQSFKITRADEAACRIAEFKIPENAEVGSELSVATFKLTESSGKLPVKKGTSNKVTTISLWIKVANTAPAVNNELLEGIDEKVVANVAPGSSVDILASSLASDVNGDELLFDVQRDPITDNPQVDITLSGSDDVTKFFTAKYVEQDGKFNKIRVTVSADYTGSDNVVFNPLYVIDSHGARSETIVKLTVKVILKPKDALKPGYDTDPAKNNLTAFRSIPMKYDTFAATIEATQPVSVRLAGNFADTSIDKGTDLTQFNENTTLIDNRNLFNDTYAPYIKVTDIDDGEGYTVDRTNKTVKVNSDNTAPTLTLPVKFQSGTGDNSVEETISLTINLSDPKPLEWNLGGISSVYKKDETTGDIAVNISTLVSDPHGRTITLDHIEGGDAMLAEIHVVTGGNIVITPKANGDVKFDVYVSIGDDKTTLYKATFSTGFEGYGNVNWWMWLMNNPIYLGCIAGGLALILLVVVLMIAKHARKKRMMKELETMLLAEMEADEQLKLTNASMMNMGMPYNPNQLGAAPGYDPNVLNLNPGMGAQSQVGYNPSQMQQGFGGQPGYGPGMGGYDANQFGGQMPGYDPNQFGQSQMPGYDPNQFGQSQFGSSQFGPGDGGYIDLDDFNNGNK